MTKTDDGREGWRDNACAGHEVQNDASEKYE